MRNLGFLFSILILFSSSLSAQEKKDTSQYSTRNNFIFWNVTTIAGDIIIMNNTWVVFGYERNFTKKLSANISAGYVFHSPEKGSFLSLKCKNSNGYNISGEIKKSVTQHLYLAGQLFFQNTLTIRTQSVADYTTVPHLHNSDYIVNRTATAIHLKFGKKYIFRSGFTIDHSLGLGVRYINSHSLNKQSNNVTDYELPYKKIFDNGSAFFLSFVYHFKLGLSFK